MHPRPNILLESYSTKSENPKKHPGVLIAFEGIDGTGKSTQAQLLADALQAAGKQIVLTREPTNGSYGQKIRELFVSRSAVSRVEELELFLADRREHVAQVVAPALAQGQIVITDRYYLSTVAYQGAAGLDPLDILAKNQEFAPFPDLVILLVLPIAQGLDRIQVMRQEALNAFEQAASLEQVAQIFDSFHGNAIRRIDGSRTPEEVHQEIMRQVLTVVSMSV